MNLSNSVVEFNINIFEFLTNIQNIATKKLKHLNHMPKLQSILSHFYGLFD